MRLMVGYKLPILEDPEYNQQDPHSMTFYSARYDTWFGKLEVTHPTNQVNKSTGEYKVYWKETPTCWVKDLK